MDYQITGDFIETCDCYVVCPCWVGDDPDEGHCTGLFAWVLDAGSRIDGVDVSGRTVVAVTTHSGNRRTAGSATALYVDRGAQPEQADLLGRAFSGQLAGPLADLATVSGAVLSCTQADIEVADPGDGWTVTVTLAEAAGLPVVQASGQPRLFEDEDLPLTLRHTALSRELGAGDQDVTAQQGQELALRVGALPGGHADVTGRSGMRGRFAYRLTERQDASAAPAGAVAPAVAGAED